MQSVIDLWQRIDQWLATHAPRILEELKPGASEVDLVEAEATLGFALPEDFKASYRIHNGGGTSLVGLLEGMTEGLSPLKWLSAHEASNEPADFVANPERKHQPVQPVMWHPGWLVFATNAGGSSFGSDLCLDLAPAAGGQVGQVIEWEQGVGPTLVIAPSFEALLTQWADWLTADVFYFENEYGQHGLEATQDWHNERFMRRERPKWKETQEQVNSEKAMTGFFSYCLRCQDIREIKNLQERVLKSGQLARLGQCSVCGTSIFVPARR